MSNTRLPSILLTLAAFAVIPVSAATVAPNTCEWANGNTGPINFVANVGTLYIPRDASVGDPIGPPEQPFIQSGGGLSIHCDTDGSTRLTFNANATAAPVPGPTPRINGAPTSGTLLQTNIAGVGALITFGSPYDGLTPGFWKLGSPDSTVPFNGYIDFRTPFVLQHPLLRGTVTLIKTGAIGRGMQTLDASRKMVDASFTGVPNAFSLALSGSVTQAECSLSATPVSADPVRLGEWPDTEFTGEGHTTPAVPFSIALNSCISDPLPGGFVANAYIRLDPAAGSRTLDADQGLFSLNDTSTAQGIGIQVLGRDGLTPVTLETDVIQGAIPDSGGMLLDFHARYYQTGPSADIGAGSAEGALAFTITYK